MSPPRSATEIKNLALLAIYSKPITDFESTDDPTAIIVNLLYDQCRQELLRKDLWNFARRRTTISKDPTDTPLFDYLGSYTLPTNLLKLHHVGTEYDLWYPPAYDIQGRKLLYSLSSGSSTAPESIYIEYTEDIEDASQFDALFIKVLRLYLASELCMPLTGSIKVQQVLIKNYKQALVEATAINHKERPMRIVNRNPIQEARDTPEDYDFGEQVRVPDEAWPS